MAWLVGMALLMAPLATAQDDPDFLFGMPRGAVSFRGGYFMSGASPDGRLFTFFEEFFITTGSTGRIEPSDFNAFVLGIDAALTLHSRLDVLFGFEYHKGGTDSEYREFLEDDGSPIQQSTELSGVPVSASIKLYLTPRGREISRFAFVPSKTRPYVGVGAGVIYYKLRQIGDFVDFVDLSIFTSEIISSGWSTEAHVFAGLDVQMGRKWYLSFEGRYLWADAGLNEPYLFDEPIDLSGLRITAGVNVSF